MLALGEKSRFTGEAEKGFCLMHTPTDLKFHTSNHEQFLLLMGDEFGGEAFHDFHLIQHLQNSCSIASVCMSEVEREKELENSASWELQSI